MRVITGTAKAKSLQTLEGKEIRPTSERVKEAVFSAIQFEIVGRRFLDLFAGSGQIGIEALSRGAVQAVFVDVNEETIKIINQNLKKCKLDEKAYVLHVDAESYLNSLENNEKFDIAFLDPPYHLDIINKVLPKLVDHIAKDGIILCESALDENLSEKVGPFCIEKTYCYGKIKITLYKNKDESK